MSDEDTVAASSIVGFFLGQIDHLEVRVRQLCSRVILLSKQEDVKIY